MKNERKFTGNLNLYLLVIAGASLVSGALFQAVLPIGNFWLGFLAAALLFFLISVVLLLTWHQSGGGKALAWMMFLAFLLRLLLAVFLAWGLPRFGYDEQPQQAGFVYEDPFRRETNAWNLAQSEESLLEAFRDFSETDQYGGILFMSAFVYRYISPDAYRPALISVLSAGAMALSVPFLVAAMKYRFDRKTVLWAGWILTLYPEGMLLGSSQMREPFFILFLAMITWAVSRWLERSRLRLAIPVFIFSAISLFLFSFRVAVPILGIAFLWIWVAESSHLKRSWLKFAGWGVIFIAFIAAVWFSRDWIDAVLHWDTLQTVRRSGRIQYQLESLPEWLSFPFILVYGIFQPVLPAAIADPAPFIWRSLGILRALGWYLLAPILVYAFTRPWKAKDPQRKRWLIIIGFIVFIWIMIASARAGGDQWDNPRYRTILLPWMAILASWGLQYARRMRDSWLARGLLIEGVFLAFFTQWYISRYYPIIPRLNFWLMIVLIIVVSLIIVMAGCWRDKKKSTIVLIDEDKQL